MKDNDETTPAPAKKGWTEERRRKQAETIRKHKPWEKSTGPKTRKGKAIASRNAFKAAGHSASAKQARKALRCHRDFMRYIELSMEARSQESAVKNELLKSIFESGG